MTKSDLQIEIVKKIEFNYDKNDLEDSFLKLKINGKDVNSSYINAIRWCIKNDIPSYVFDISKINITENNSLYDNDYMSHRLSCMMLPNINCDINYLENKYWDEVNYSDPNRPKHEDDNIQLSLNVNVNNSQEKIKNVMSNSEGVEFYLNNRKIRPYLKNFPELIIKLKKDQKFACSCTGVLGVGVRNTIWSVADCFHTLDNSDGTFYLNIKSRNQFTETNLVEKVCKHILIRLNILKENVENYDFLDESRDNDEELLNIDISNDKSKKGGKNKSNDSLSKVIIVKFANEGMAIPAIINENIQNECLASDDVIYSGVSKRSVMINKTIIKVCLKIKGTSEKKVRDEFVSLMIRNINKSIDFYETFLSKFKFLQT